MALLRGGSGANADMRVHMVRPDLERIPEFGVPAPFRVRWYEPGDEAEWRRIHRLADRENETTPGLFGERFGADAAVLARRQCYLTDERGAAIGTATAWFDDDFAGLPYGRVHYVAITPEYQGRGLSKPLMTVVCRRLRELGHKRAYLSTATTRVAAIRLYLRFGFMPWAGNPEETAAWRAAGWEPGGGQNQLRAFGKVANI
jgi:GNAT superfamily N-acetyltransferase